MTDTAATLTVLIEGKEVGLKTLIRETEQGLRSADRLASQAGKGIGDKMAQGASKARSGFLQLQSQIAKNEAQAGNYAAAIQRLERVIDAQNISDKETLQLQNQLIRVRQQSIKEIERQTQATERARAAEERSIAAGKSAQQARVAAATAGVQSLLGSVGLALGAAELIRYSGEALGAANSLEKTEAKVRALSGSQARYNEVLALARSGQQLYGGSLQSNLEGLGGLVNLSNRAGVELASLDNIARRLATVDPVQGIEGASYALKEFFSGNTSEAARTLIERFELSPQLKEIAASGLSATEKIAALDAELNKLGITNEVLTNATNTNAAAYDRLGAAVDNAKVKIGQYLAEAGKASAIKLTGVLESEGQGQRTTQGAVDQGKDYQQYLTDLRAASAEIDRITAGDPIANWITRQMAGLEPLPQALYNVALALQATGVSGEQATLQAQGLTGFYSQLTLLSTDLGRGSAEAKAGFDALIPSMLDLGLQGDGARTAVLGLIEQFAETGNIEAFQQGLNQLAIAQQDNIALNLANADSLAVQASATADAALASSELGQWLLEESASKQEAAEKAATLASYQATLGDLSSAVVGKLMSSEQAARILANSYNIAYNEALKLIQAQAALGQSNGRVAGIQNPAGGGPNGFGVTASDAERKKIQEAKARRREEAKATATAAEKQRILNEEVKIAEQRYGRYSEQASRARTESKQFAQQQEQQAAAEAKRNQNAAKGKGRGAGGAGGTSATENRQRLTDQEKLNNQLLTSEEKHQQRLSDLQSKRLRERERTDREHRKRMLDAQKKFNQSSLDSDASFYDRQRSIQSQAVREQASAEYESARQESEKIAAEQGADAAEAYLQAQEEIIQKRAERRQELEDLRSTTDSSGEAKSADQVARDQAEAEYLEGIMAKEEKANQERLRQLRENGSAIANEYAEQKREEAAQYAESRAAIEDADDRATTKIVTNAQRQRKEIDATTAALNRQEQTINRIAGTSPESTPATASAPTGGTPPTAASGTQADPATALLAEVQSLRSDVVTRLESLERAQNDTTSAIRDRGATT